MSATYIIEVGPASDFRFDPDQLGREVCIKWPDTRLAAEGDLADESQYSWSVMMNGQEVLCVLSETFDSLWMRQGTLEEYCEIAIWLRTLVPARHSLCIYYSGGDEGDEVEIKPSSTVTSLLAELRST
jgi:hypothetical protein